MHVGVPAGNVRERWRDGPYIIYALTLSPSQEERREDSPAGARVACTLSILTPVQSLWESLLVQRMVDGVKVGRGPGVAFKLSHPELLLGRLIELLPHQALFQARLGPDTEVLAVLRCTHGLDNALRVKELVHLGCLLCFLGSPDGSLVLVLAISPPLNGDLQLL